MVSVLTEGELETQETELTRRMNETKDKKTQTAGALAESKREVDQFRDSYEIVLAEDKALDKPSKGSSETRTYILWNSFINCLNEGPGKIGLISSNQSSALTSENSRGDAGEKRARGKARKKGE